MAAASPAAGTNRAFVKSFGQGAPPTRVLHQAPETQVLGGAPATKVVGAPETKRLENAPETQKIDRDSAAQPKDQDQQPDQDQDQGQQSKNDSVRVLKGVKVRMPGIPDPGSLTFPLLFLLLLLFFVQPVSGTKKTRAAWLWSVLTGSGQLPQPDSGVWSQKQAWNDQWNQKKTG